MFVMRTCLLAALVSMAAALGRPAVFAEQPVASPSAPSSLPGTEPLDWSGDIASRLVDGADRFLMSELDKSVARRAKFWHRDESSAENYNASIEPNRKRLAQILGVRDPRVTFAAPELVATTTEAALIARTASYQVFAVRWPAFGDVHGEGLLLVPIGKPVADVVAIPDADQTPEMLAGLEPVREPPAERGTVPFSSADSGKRDSPRRFAESQFARRLCESGCRVLVPVLIQRAATQGKISDRELLYRPAFEMGRHIIGYEVQKVLAGVDWFSNNQSENRLPRGGQSPFTPPTPQKGTVPGGSPAKIGVIGWGEGGMLALYAGALDPRIGTVCVSGYFASRQNIWQEPIYRNVFGLLEQFGDAELAAMIAPRTLVIEAAKGPEVVVPSGTGGGPGRLTTPKLDDVRSEVGRARQLVEGFKSPPRLELVESGDGSGPYGSSRALQAFLTGLSPGATLAASGGPAELQGELPDAAARQHRQFHELDLHNQALVMDGENVRKKFFAKLDTSSPAAYSKTIEPYRDYFRDEVIGRFDQPLLPPHPRTRKSYEGKNWIGYEVVLDVFPDVIAYGLLLVPKDLQPGERRPVVVCQHGLESHVVDVIAGDSHFYHDFAARLADRGFVTFAPQNLYLFGDRFRVLQRKANPLKKTLYSIIVPQHQQIVDWLGSMPFVDRQRIGFYGLSYGGKTAMRVPPLVAGYSTVICSGDFNDWIWKTASSIDPQYSYVPKNEYEMFEFDLGSTFNYAELAALIAPRPFMVERGHFDGVGSDERVGYEFAKVRFLYEARLKLVDRCRIEWFDGPHTIHGVGTFDFMHQHLSWPNPKSVP